MFCSTYISKYESFKNSICLISAVKQVKMFPRSNNRSYYISKESPRSGTEKPTDIWLSALG